MTKRKYKNKPTIVDDIEFHSKKEARRYSNLKLLEQAGIISDLELQPKFDLIPTLKIHGKTHRKITYSADFAYTNEQGQRIIEDVKSEATAKDKVFIIKKRLMKWVHDIDVLVT
ncbi:MAG: DUF1064 domain-containing protein [Moraxellaceae bacterium]|nr:DUF1064 domain-containing protein [Moraxellaceae bacterium]